MQASDPLTAPAPGSAADARTRQLVTEALHRLLRDDCLRNAPQMSAFLRYVVERSLAGDAGRIKGYTIGVEALGKQAGFDPHSDPSVRVLAKRLRDTLRDYYARGERHAARISLCTGHYRPEFVLEDGVEAAEPVPVARPEREGRPVLHLVIEPAAQALERRLALVLGGALSRLGGVQVRRAAEPPRDERASDRVLSLCACRLGASVRLDLTLTDACEGAILRADAVAFPAADDDALDQRALDALTGWLADALADDERPLGTARADAAAACAAAAEAFDSQGLVRQQSVRPAGPVRLSRKAL